MIKPKALKPGSTIGIVAPSSPSKLSESKIAGDILKKLGFNVKLGQSWARDINDMFADSEIDGIICLKAGYGSVRILDKLDYERIKKNPKVFVGYSDITAIHIALNKLCELVTFHGPMVASDITRKFDDYSRMSLLNALTSVEALGELENPEGEEIQPIVGGVAEGEIIGGNLSLIAATIGTPYEIDAKGKLLFIEEVGEHPCKVDRMLTQIRLAGKFEECSGIILADWNNCNPEEGEESLSLMEVFSDIIKPSGKPTIFNLKAGHCTPKMTVPLGVNAILDANNGKVIIKESACCDR
jgi:muramoyltetrapeptide carboxypeptidase